MKTEQSQKQQKQQQIQEVKPIEKKSRRNKADISKASKLSHNTRRRVQPDSSQQNLLPTIIPKTIGDQCILTEGFENQLSKVVIRVPFSLLLQEIVETVHLVKVQNKEVLIKIQKQKDNITISARCPMKKNKMEVQQIKKITQPQDLQIDNNSNFSQDDITCIINIWGRYVYISHFQNQNKNIKKVRKQLNSAEDAQIIKFKVKQINSDMFVSLNLSLEQAYTDKHNGLVNQGNTCYMNSYLQTLYHIPAFRNLVYQAEIQDQTKFPATLQQLFFHMEKSEKSVSPQQLVKSFGWGKKEASIQQDAQQFSCLFFEVLERKLSESCPKDGYKSLPIHNLFKGNLNHYIRCKEVDFRNENQQQFIDLQLPIFPTLTEALDEYTSQAHMQGDNKYNTTDYGLQEAFKGVRIALFPPVLMIQLKRFQYSFQQQKNIKILTELGYQEQFDFSKWSSNKGQSQLYELYAVLVHEGARAESGHYYNFVKYEDQWYKCNDQLIQQVQKQKVFKYNFGGFHQTLQFDAKEMKVTKKHVQSKTTAYMLVYIKKSYKQILTKQQNKYPEWILNKIENRQEMQEMKKNRKKFYHNVGFIDWKRDLQGKNCSQVGFLDEPILQKSKRLIEKIPKQEKMSQWLFTQNIIQSIPNQNKNKSRKGSKVIERERPEQVQLPGIYLYYVNSQRQILVGYSAKSHHSMDDFLKITTNAPQPLILKTPFQVKKQEYLCVVKRFKVIKNHENTNIQFYYETVLAIPKEIKYNQLNQILFQKFYQPQKIDVDGDSISNQNKKTLNFYIEDQKLGPIKLNDFSAFIPFPVPSRNQLLVCVIEQLPINLTIEEQIKFKYLQWYKNKKDTINLIVAQEKSFQFTQLKQMSISLNLSDLRNLIFDKFSPQKKIAYGSAQNIVLKARLKKSKIYSEVSQSQFPTIRDIIKIESRIEYSFSSLKVDSRLSQYQLNLYYRSKDMMFHGPFQIIVHRDDSNQNIIKFIKNHEKVLQLLNQDEQNQKQVDVLLFTKDRMVINYIVNDQGKVLSKGQFDQVIKKQKNAVLVVESRKILSLQNQTKIQLKQDDIDPVVYILLHHISQTYERVGTPRVFKVDIRIELFQLKNKIIDLIMNDYFGWQGKVHPCQPFKIKILLYSKDSKKTVDLTNLQAIEQIKRLKIQEKNINQQQNRKKSKDYKNSTRKASTISQNKDKSPTYDFNNFEQVKQNQNKENIQINGQGLGENQTNKKSNGHINGHTSTKLKNEQPKSEEIKNEQFGQGQDQNQQEIEAQQITQVQGPETIYGIFPKGKILKIQIIHSYLIKPNIALRLNVDD